MAQKGTRTQIAARMKLGARLMQDKSEDADFVPRYGMVL